MNVIAREELLSRRDITLAAYRDACWFTDIWAAHGRPGMYLREFHYTLVDLGTVTLPPDVCPQGWELVEDVGALPYEDDGWFCYKVLKRAFKIACRLRLVDAEAFGKCTTLKIMALYEERMRRKAETTKATPQTRIEDLPLSSLAINCLHGAKIGTVAGLMQWTAKDLLRLEGLGWKSVAQIEHVLKAAGLALEQPVTPPIVTLKDLGKKTPKDLAKKDEQIACKVPVALAEAIKRAAREDGRTVSAWMRRHFTDFFRLPTEDGNE